MFILISCFNLDNARVTRKPGNVTKEHVSAKKMLCEAHCLQSKFSKCYNIIVKTSRMLNPMLVFYLILIFLCTEKLTVYRMKGKENG